MHFRNRKKTAQDVLISDPIDTDKDGNTLTLIDVIADDTDIKIKIRNPKGTKFRFMSQYDGSGDLTAEETDDGYILTVSNLHSWSVGTVFCDEN